MSNRLWHEEYIKELKSEQENKTREEIASELESKSEYVFDPDNAPVQGHRWVDRGLKLSCEGANHPYHQAFKRR